MATQKEIAEHLDLSERRVRDLMKDGILPGSKGKGGYELDACRLAYIAYLRSLANGQTSAPETPPPIASGFYPDEEGMIDADHEEARRKKYDADLKKEKLKLLRRENAPVSIITEVISSQMEAVSAALRAMPMQIKLAEPSLSSRSIDRIKATISSLCNQLTDVKPDISGYCTGDPDSDQEGDEFPESSEADDGS